MRVWFNNISKLKGRAYPRLVLIYKNVENIKIKVIVMKKIHWKKLIKIMIKKLKYLKGTIKHLLIKNFNLLKLIQLIKDLIVITLKIVFSVETIAAVLLLKKANIIWQIQVMKIKQTMTMRKEITKIKYKKEITSTKNFKMMETNMWKSQ